MAPLIKFGVSTAVLLLAAVSLFGWGKLVRRLANMANGTWPVTIGLGLSTVLMLGGILNVARLAFAWTLWGLAAAGIAFAIFYVGRSRRSPPVSQREGWALTAWIEAGSAGAFIALATGFAIATQLPPRVFHLFDDFQKYFAYPVRQLETGTLFGSPLSALGSETLGGMAFLQSFVLSVAPIEFINGVDAVFGFFLLMCLGAVAGWRRMTPLPGALFAPLVIAAIDPEYINVSALFLGAALMATAVLLTAHEREDDPPSALGVGLVYGGLVALKPTFALFVVLHLPLVAVALSFVHGARAGGLWASRAAAFAALALSPWLILHLPHYLDTSSLATTVVPGGPQESIRLSLRYTNLIALALLAVSWAVIGQIHERSKANLTRIATLVATAASVGLAYGILIFLGPVLAGYETSLRYSIPFLLGVVPLIGVLSVRKWSSQPSWLVHCLPLAGYLAAVIPFIPSMLERYQQAFEFHSIYASDAVRSQKYIQYNRSALSAASDDAVRKLQHLIPPGEPLLAWTNQPYGLDFRRNPILDADPAGMATYWAHLPPTVHYVFWEHHGFGVLTPRDFSAWEQSPGWHERLIAVRARSFAQSLTAELSDAKILYMDNRFVVAQFVNRPSSR
jgi:hypothetical protein